MRGGDKLRLAGRGVRMAAVAFAVAALAGCSGGQAKPEDRHPLRGGFTPARAYDPKIDVPVEKHVSDPTKYTRHWDAETQGGTGVYEPWRDPMWTPREEFGVLGGW